MKKEILRKKYKLIRHNIQNKEYQNNLIFNKIINHDTVLSSKNILIYVSLNDEVDTYNIIKYFINDKNIYVPKVIGNEMQFYKLNDIHELIPGSFNIMEPTSNQLLNDVDNSVCIVPGICFDKNNNRIGYGKGFYDKFLQNKNIYTIGICFNECIVPKIDTDINDIKVNEVISAK